MINKEVTVIGCCMGRNIFNCPQLINSFHVNNFLFQIPPWSCFDEPLDIPQDELKRVSRTNFEAKVLDYNLNKNALSSVNAQETDYLVIDLVACSFVMYEIRFRDRVLYTRIGFGDKPLNRMMEYEFFKKNNFSYRKIPYPQVPQDIVERGMANFAKWVKEKFSEKKVIICIPSFPTRYLDKDLKVKEYSQRKIQQLKHDEEYVIELSKRLISEIGECLVYNFPDNMISMEWGWGDSPYHYTNMDYIRQGYQFMDLLNLKLKDVYDLDISPESLMVEGWVKKYQQCRKKVLDTQSRLLKKEFGDCFDGTSVSSVSTQEFGKGLLPLNTLMEMIKIEK